MEEISRRSLLVGACALVAVGSTALPAAAQTAIRTLPDGRLEVRVKDVPELRAVGGAVSIGSMKGTPMGVARTGVATFRAFSLRCPHQGVPVARSQKGWTCPAHGSEFDPDGDLILGPATRALTRIPASLKRGRLVVG